MRESCTRDLFPAIEIEGTVVPSREQLFTKKVAKHARVEWPNKTAANWASRAKCSERLAKFWLADPPQRAVSAEGLWAVLAAIGARE